jgi:hypothetical protein
MRARDGCLPDSKAASPEFADRIAVSRERQLSGQRQLDFPEEEVVDVGQAQGPRAARRESGRWDNFGTVRS